MNIQQKIIELTALPLAERLQIVEGIWESIDAESPSVDQAVNDQELRRRILDQESLGGELLTWEEVLDRLKTKIYEI
ncbi:MAG: addiction module protein [Pirellulales bacterium]|nr:addiction module protein [Pirellulales bacterium]